MFCLPPQGGELPAPGTRVMYEVIMDPKTGRPRAENLQLEDAAMSGMSGMLGGASKGSGTMQHIKSNFGFIKPDSGGEDVFCLPPQGGALPPVGTRVVYDIIMDPKTGRARAENIELEAGSMSGGAQQASGTVEQVMGNFGFIKPDDGSQDVFLLPPQGVQIPPVGTRVTYDSVLDSTTGRPRAENVQMAQGKMAASSGFSARSQPY
eukprot:TRINITY_DN45_c0_g1_i1.p1 TRINITY_DN45_c0_g1~~TRINITY_DN45_c0_g1_i1.p1  ORF type:complete len:228 (+),score=49.29 TRINITY_DN45_c0_g1_i1:66-686(+)